MFKLPTDLTIATAEQFKQLIMDYSNDHDHVVIDDSDVVKIDTIGVQLLLASITYLVALNKTIEWQCNAELIKESIAKLGVDEPLLTQFFDNP